MFRERVCKKRAIPPVQQGTLDVRHDAKLREFAERAAALEQSRADGSATEREVAAGLEALEDARLDYWERTFELLHKYYLMCAAPIAAVNAIPAAVQPTGKKMAALPGQQSLLQFLSPHQQQPATPAQRHASDAGSKSAILRKYLSVVDPSQARPMRRTRAEVMECPRCHAERIVMEQDGVAVCPQCNSQDVVLVDSDRATVRTETSKEYSTQSYRRVNHLAEHIAQIQGRETTVIPESIVDSIMLELKKERMTDMRRITPRMMRGILKRLGASRYYEHITTIIRMINGLPPIRISPELEEKIKCMFKEVQPAYSRVCPSTRTNFLQYNFCIGRILLLLDEPELASHFPPLKSREKQAQQDAIWRSICAELKWKYMPSL